MSELVAQSGFSQAHMGALLDWVRGQPDGVQQQILTQATNEGLNSQQLAGLIQEQMDQQSAAAEASLVQGGYDIGVATAVAGSVGVGSDAETVQQASEDFARMAAEAVRNGQPFGDLRYNNPHLDLRVQEAIYAQVAAQQGRSPEQIATKAAEADTQAMAAVQQAVFGGAVAASAATQTVDPLAAALAGTNVVQQFGAALNNYASNGQRNQPGGRENERGGWDIG